MNKPTGVAVAELPASRSHARRSRAVAGVALALTFSAGVIAGGTRFGGAFSAGASTSMADQPEFTVLQETWDVIHNEYVDEAAIDSESLIHGAAKGMVDSLGDTGHTQYLTPEEADAYQEAVSGRLIGIGVQIDYSSGRPVVIAPIDGSPAAEAGIMPQDVIVAVDDQPTDKLTEIEIFEAIRGEEGTSVRITFERPSENREFTLTLERRVIEIAPVSWTMLPEKVALIRVSQFSQGAWTGVRDALVAANEQGATALILDLRGNPGGLVTEAIGVASQFLPEGSPIYQMDPRGEEPDVETTTGIGEGLELPMVVLIDAGSASASEIVASALQENGRAELIGATTFGTGTVLRPHELSDGSLVLVGFAFWLTSQGENIWHVGVEPQLEVEIEPGDTPFRPGDDVDVSRSEYEEIEDAQLEAGFEAVTELVRSGA